MTIDVSIRPDAALNDPDTHRYVEENVLNATYRWAIRGSLIPNGAYNEDGITNILANYPWQKFRYKAGHWQKQPVINQFPFIPWKEWSTFNIPVLLEYPETGRPIVQVASVVDIVDSPSGDLLFAGDPDYAGVVKATLDGKPHLTIVGSVHLSKISSDGSKLDNGGICQRARDLAKSMVPEQTPQVPLYDLPANYLKNRGPWIADHPKKPPRKWKPEADDAQSGA